MATADGIAGACGVATDRSPWARRSPPQPMGSPEPSGSSQASGSPQLMGSPPPMVSPQPMGWPLPMAAHRIVAVLVVAAVHCIAAAIGSRWIYGVVGGPTVAIARAHPVSAAHGIDAGSAGCGAVGVQRVAARYGHLSSVAPRVCTRARELSTRT